MSVVIGIDIGGSSTKIVGFAAKKDGWELIEPQIIKANDPVTATYGAFGKFTDENNLSISDISKVMMTGVGASHVKHNLYGLNCERVAEFDSIGRGGIYLSGLPEALVVSMGTGTAMVHARADGTMKYLGGTGVGGGTLVGLSKLLLNAESIEHIESFAECGSLDNIDLRIKDMTASKTLDHLEADLTAAKKVYRAGDTAEVVVYRGGTEVTLSIVFDVQPEETITEEPQQDQQQNNNGNYYGNGGYDYNYGFTNPWDIFNYFYG